MNTREKTIIFKWLKIVGKFPNKKDLPKNVAVLEQLRCATGQSSWSDNQISEFAARKAIEFPELKRRPKKTKRKIPFNPRPQIKTFSVRPAQTNQTPPRDPNFSVDKYREFMQSEGWRAVRYLALRKYGNHCKACGRGPEDSVKIHVDHIIPCSRAWDRRFDIRNLQTLCEDCNMGKGGAFADDWRTKP